MYSQYAPHLSHYADQMIVKSAAVAVAVAVAVVVAPNSVRTVETQ